MPNSDYAPGLPEKGVYGDLEALSPGQMVTYALQEHSTDRRRGKTHYDLRLGTPETGLFSWAVPKARLPGLKEKLLAVRTELHRYGYGKFKGRIGEGYGAGTVRQADYGDAVIHSMSPRSMQFTIAHSKVPTRYRLMHIKDDQWLLFNTTPQGVQDMPQMKPFFKLITDEELPNVLEHAKEVQAKIDGALGVFHIDPKGRMEAYSPRRRVTGEPISYTERLGLGQQTYPDLGDTVLRGEVFGEKQAAADLQEYQQRAIDKLKDTDALLVYHGLGSGKTLTALGAAEQFKMPLTVVGPASLRSNFDKEKRKHHIKALVDYYTYNKPPSGGRLVAFDEAHRMGRSGTQRSQYPDTIKGDKKIFLTGTPLRNDPTELIPLMRGLGVDIGDDPREFAESYVDTYKQYPGLWGMIRGVKPGIVRHAMHLDRLKDMLRGKVDYQPSAVDDYPVVEEKDIPVEMSPLQEKLYRAAMGSNPKLKYKVEHGLSPSKSESGPMNAFLSATRQIGNYPREFEGTTIEDAPKLRLAVEEIKRHAMADPNYRGVTYSNYLSHGVEPVKELLDAEGIPASLYTGNMAQKKKDKAVRAYNKGRIKQLLISGAGSEGLDLKGTKLMQLLEPHWNQPQLDQVKGRAVRYQSHSHLPPEERKVEIQNFIAGLRPRGWIFKTKDTSSDEYLRMLSKQKSDLNQQFLQALQEVGSEKAAYDKSAQEVIPFNELSGLMNSNLNKAIPAAQARKIALKTALFDVVRYRGMDVSQLPYSQRKALLIKIMGQLPQNKFTLPESASTPEDVQNLVARIRTGQHPATQEGVVIDNKYKYKIRPDATGYIVGTFPGEGKRKTMAGGILYTDQPGGTTPVGKIGTGFSDTEIAEISKGIQGLMGRPFRFTHRGQTASGNYREPSFQGWETDKPDVKVASDLDGSFVAGTKLSLEEEYDSSKKVNTIAGQKVVTVDGNSIKLKNDMNFVEGGNDQAYDYVPKGQVWIDKAINPKERKFIALHELLEQRLMRNRRMSYEKAHAKANVEEKKYRQQVKKALLELGSMLKGATMDKKVPVDTVPLAISGQDGVLKATVDAEMADTAPKKVKGLSGRKEMSEKAAMLFTSPGPFWMKGVNFGLDLIFLDKAGQVTSFGTMPQGSQSLYIPDPMAKLALEVAAGTCQKIGLQPGDRVGVPAI